MNRAWSTGTKEWTNNKRRDHSHQIQTVLFGEFDGRLLGPRLRRHVRIAEKQQRLVVLDVAPRALVRHVFAVAREHDGRGARSVYHALHGLGLEARSEDPQGPSDGSLDDDLFRVFANPVHRVSDVEDAGASINSRLETIRVVQVRIEDVEAFGGSRQVGQEADVLLATRNP